MEYRHGGHTVFNIEYHFVWVTNYRYKVLVEDVALRVRELVRQTCGNVTDGMIKTYLEHHFEPKKDDEFRTE